MLVFHPLEVLAVDPIAQDAVCLRLAIPRSLREQFKHHAGQYVSVRRMIDGREERRTYSIVTAPGAAELRIGVRQQYGGRMSQALARLVRGDELDVGAPPAGRFRASSGSERGRVHVAFAAGSGITPVLSLAADILERQPQSRFTLIYGNRSMARTMFLEDTLALKNRHLGRFSVYFVMSREPQHAPLLNGRIDAAKVEALAARIAEVGEADEYFVCGPGGMADEVRGAIGRLNPRAPVRAERFTAAAPAAAAIDLPESGAAAGPELPAGEVLSEVCVVMDGRRRSFAMSPADGSVLEAAERAGLELPFSCRAGICATCRTKVKAGGATMRHNIALAPWEIEAGFILCCQARPLTPSLELSYDEK
ncbi:MAG TPA: 2Fe-2S iron-sulfur cluster-binding protein [Steroidobacteraceae bacterium]|nr:2Fe-2S iron-sulfur cluster-binding protein [Steroidobacteraceae bacterium]